MLELCGDTAQRVKPWKTRAFAVHWSNHSPAKHSPAFTAEKEKARQRDQSGPSPWSDESVKMSL
jgi:hypothetical protein